MKISIKLSKKRVIWSLIVIALYIFIMVSNDFINITGVTIFMSGTGHSSAYILLQITLLYSVLVAGIWFAIVSADTFSELNKGMWGHIFRKYNG